MYIMTGGERMKKLVAVTTTILIILIAVLGIFMIKGHGSDSSTAKSTLSDLKESLSDKNGRYKGSGGIQRQ